MKSFIFTDLNGNKHCLQPSAFTSNSVNLHCRVSAFVLCEIVDYGKKARAYMVARQSKRQTQEKAYHELFEKISFLCSCGFPSVPIYEVLDAFSQAYALQSLYRHHVAFCRGYVGVDERKKPIFWFYFGTFGGGFKYHEFFSTRYCYRHLLLLSSWWFVNGDVAQGYSKSKMAMFENFCKYGELSIGS